MIVGYEVQGEEPNTTGRMHIYAFTEKEFDIAHNTYLDKRDMYFRTKMLRVDAIIEPCEALEEAQFVLQRTVVKSDRMK